MFKNKYLCILLKIGLIDLNGKLIKQLSKGKGLNGRTILSLYQDNLDNLWVGLSNGIAYVELGSPFTLINEDQGLIGTGYASALHQNRIILGTNTGAFTHTGNLQDLDLKPYEIIPGSEGQVYSFNKIQDKIVIGHHNGAYELIGNGTQRFLSNTGIWLYKRLNNFPDFFLEGYYHGINVIGKSDDKWVLQYKVNKL